MHHFCLQRRRKRARIAPCLRVPPRRHRTIGMQCRKRKIIAVKSEVKPPPVGVPAVSSLYSSAVESPHVSIDPSLRSIANTPFDSVLEVSLCDKSNAKKCSGNASTSSPAITPNARSAPGCNAVTAGLQQGQHGLIRIDHIVAERWQAECGRIATGVKRDSERIVLAESCRGRVIGTRLGRGPAR